MLDSRQANQIPGEKKGSGFAVFLCFVFIVWTGIFAWYSFKQYHLSGKMEEQMISFLIKHGGAKAEEYEEMQTWDFCSSLIKSSLSQTGTLSYLVRYKEDIPKSEEKDIVKLASLFSGKKSDTALWCAAAGKKSLENDLFLQSDKTISTLLAEESKAGKKQKEHIAENTEEETEDLDTPEDELSVPAQSILLFQNGSPDITSQNKAGTSEKAVSGDTLLDSREQLAENNSIIKELQKSYSRSYLLSKFYITDSTTSIDNQVFQVKKLLTTNLKMKKESKPQILIFHTHGASEAFIDSKAGRKEDSIIGVGSVLAEILSEQYGYQVLHDKTEYDRINGKIDRNKAYNNAYKGLQKTLEKYPSIQVIIDLHRDGVGNAVQRITRVAGKRTAQVMFFNGLSRNSSGDIAYLHNDNLQGNLAFSLQLKIACMKRFENFARPVYLKGYRYNMHLRKRFTLIELGNENNTVQEAKNAMPPLAMAIDAVLTGQ